MGRDVTPLKENADLPDFTPERAHLLLQEVYGDFQHHNDGLHLNGGVADDAIWQSCWIRLTTQSATWYAMASGAVGHRFKTILAAEWRRVLGRSWNSKRPLIFVHVILTKTLVIHRAKEIQAKIFKQMDLWERGFNTGLVGDDEAEGAI